MPEDQVGVFGGVSILDESYPRSLINIVPDEMRLAILRSAHEQLPLYYLPEHQLLLKCEPDSDTCRLKLTFWDEYCRAQDKGITMNMRAVYRGVCSSEFFRKVILPDDKKIVWIVTPPKDHMIVHREMLEIGLEEQRRVLMLPLWNKKGGLDHKLLSEKLKLIENLKLRVYGAVPHRIEQKNLNVNVGTRGGTAAFQIPNDAGLEELMAYEDRLKRLKEASSGEENTIDARAEEEPS